MITLENITCRFGRTKVALDGINLEITPGHIIGLLGKNGEGKSTLLKIVSGLIFPTTGICCVQNEKSANRAVSFLNQLYFLPEDSRLPDLKVKDYFKMYASFYPTFSKEILENCIRLFDINVLESINKMSMGQKKKVAVTLALAVNTPVLLMDEPTNGMDIPSKSIFRKLVASWMTPERTVIISTHQARDLETLIDAVIILDRHKVAFSCDFEEIGKKLAFCPVGKDEEVLFSDITPAGKIGVIENKYGEESEIDLELLFNAVVNNEKEIGRIFS